jgi:ferric-dicitrate binding protein FerR (iron transport regulator)
MDKKIYDPAELAYKWEQGTITHEERIWFEHWYKAFNDEEVLIHHTDYTAPEQIRDNIFKRISEQMETPPLRTVKVFRLWKSITAAAVVLFIIGLAVLYNKDIANLVKPVQQVLISSDAGQHRQISLPDGTKVWLSPATQISYPDHFSNAKREVKLTGEAFFEVVHDTKHPFIINSGKLKTVVLGTSFNVRAYPKAKSAEVTVVSGKVGVMLNTTSSHKQQIIVANQRTVFYPATGALLKEDYPDGARFLDQRNGLFHFNGASLGSIINELQLQYGLSISLAPGLNNKAFYGNLNTSVPVEQTLNKLCTVMEIHWSRKNGIYYLQENSIN